MLAFHCCHVGTPDPTGSTQKYLCPTRPGPRQRKTKRKSSGTSFLGGKIGGDQDTPIYGHQNTGKKELSTHFWMKKRKWGVLIFRHNPKFGSVSTEATQAEGLLQLMSPWLGGLGPLGPQPFLQGFQRSPNRGDRAPARSTERSLHCTRCTRGEATIEKCR